MQNWVREVEEYSEAALSLLRLIADRVRGYGVGVHYDYEVAPGLSRWFPITIWFDAIQKAGGQPWIDDSWYRPPERNSDDGLWRLFCGSQVIGVAADRETLITYEHWHKNLRDTYEKDEPAKQIAAKSQELESTAKEIRQRLQEFGDKDSPGGRCELENPE